eukprot:14557052-Alexandrium_andersonii.AAC.1
MHGAGGLHVDESRMQTHQRACWLLQHPRALTSCAELCQEDAPAHHCIGVGNCRLVRCPQWVGLGAPAGPEVEKDPTRAHGRHEHHGSCPGQGHYQRHCQTGTMLKAPRDKPTRAPGNESGPVRDSGGRAWAYPRRSARNPDSVQNRSWSIGTQNS